RACIPVPYQNPKTQIPKPKSQKSQHANQLGIWSLGFGIWDLGGGHLHSLHREHFDDVAHLDVVVALEADAAFEAGFDLAYVVFEAAQRGDLPFEYDHVVAQEAGGGLARAGDAPLRDHAAGNRPDLRHAEPLRHLGGSDADFLERRLEETLHALLDLLGDVINHRMESDVHLFALRHVRRIAIGPDIEADDDRVRCGGKQHVGLVDRADTRADDADLHLLVRQLRQRVREHFRGALHVRLDDDRQLLDATFGNLFLERFEREASAARTECAFLRLRLAEGRNLPRLCRVGHGLERIAWLRKARQPEDFDRGRRRRQLHRPSTIVDERAHASDDRARDEVVADAQRAVLHEDGCDRT